MKNIFVVIVLALLFIMSGANAIAQDSTEHHQKMEKMDKKESNHDMESMDNGQQDVTLRNIDPKTAASIKKIVDRYLQLKNALVSDNTKDAAAAGKEIIIALEKLDKSFLTAEQKKVYEDVEDDAKEMAEHIGDNAGKIDHQREHFDMLSNDVYDLVKAFGGGQVLYKYFCPKYNDKKGAIWLSESKTIKNPYYGKKMLNCGSLKEEIK